MNRRIFLICLIIALSENTILFASSAVDREQLVPIIWYVPAELTTSIQTSLGLTGSAIPDVTTKDDSRSPAAIYILAGSVALATLCETLLNVYKNWKYGGVLIRRDKKGRLELVNVPSIENGTIIVDQGSNIKVILREKDKLNLSVLMDSLKGLTGK
jgi:hypothetical protein